MRKATIGNLSQSEIIVNDDTGMRMVGRKKNTDLLQEFEYQEPPKKTDWSFISTILMGAAICLLSYQNHKQRQVINQYQQTLYTIDSIIKSPTR